MPPFITRSTDVVASMSWNASRSLVTTTERQPAARARAAPEARTSSASQPGGHDDGEAGRGQQRGGDVELLDEVAGLGRPVCLVGREVGPAVRLARAVEADEDGVRPQSRRGARDERHQALDRPHRPALVVREATVETGVVGAVEKAVAVDGEQQGRPLVPSPVRHRFSVCQGRDKPRRPATCVAGRRTADTARYRYWPVFATVSIVRPGSEPSLPWMIVRM